MKRIRLVLFVVALLGLSLTARSALALGFIDLNAWVIPAYDNFDGLGDTTGTARYELGVDVLSSYGASEIYLMFESDIFDDVQNVSVISAPLNWTIGLDDSDPLATQLVGSQGSGDSLDPGESIILTVDYTLTDPYAFFYGADPNNPPPSWAWTIDGPNSWEQAVGALQWEGEPGRSPLTAFGFGSTVPVPEPSTLILLGSGLAAIGMFSLVRRGRRRVSPPPKK